MAAADGVVVEAREGAQESDGNLQQPGESKAAMSTVASATKRCWRRAIGSCSATTGDPPWRRRVLNLRTSSCRKRKGEEG